MLQPPVFGLMQELCDRGYEVLLETGGSLDIRSVDPRVRRIVDIKCPASGESEANLWSNLDDLRKTDELKLVVQDRADFDWGVETLRQHAGPSRCGAILWSPVHGVCDPTELASWLVEARAPGRLQIQLHRLLWPSAERGV